MRKRRRLRVGGRDPGPAGRARTAVAGALVAAVVTVVVTVVPAAGLGDVSAQDSANVSDFAPPRDLGTLGGPASGATDVNEAGVVVGTADSAESEHTHAALWETDETIRDLGTLGGARAYAMGVNAAGVVVGSSEVSAPWVEFAFVWDPTTGEMRDISGGMPSAALDVNEAGRIAGYTHGGGSGYEAALWEADGTRRDLGTLGGLRSVATAINDAGWVVGYSNVADSRASHAFLWDPTSGVMPAIGTLGGDDSWAVDVNEAGQIVGKSELTPGASNAEHAFLWDPTTGEMEDIGTLGGAFSTAWGLNDVGQVVGSSTLAVGDSVGRGFVWDRTGGMRLLGTLGGRTEEAAAVNDAGRIVGMSETPDFAGRAVIWEVPPPGDRMDVTFRGGHFGGFHAGGALRSGNVAVQRDGDGVRRVWGSGVLPGPDGSDVPVAVDVRRLWILALYVGAVHVSLPGGVARTPVVTGALAGADATVGATSSWIDTFVWPWAWYRLTWTVTDAADDE
ncbi:MAG: DUF3466 family protein [Acidimicrobiia bacterium]|nr:DUF3466 family protein [Acidimicrobiia bacterium]